MLAETLWRGLHGGLGGDGDVEVAVGTWWW